MVRLEVVLYACLYFPMFLAVGSQPGFVHAAANIGLQALVGMSEVCGSWAEFSSYCVRALSHCAIISLCAPLVGFLAHMWCIEGLLGSLKVSQLLECCLKWLGAKLTVWWAESTVNFSIVTVSIFSHEGNKSSVEDFTAEIRMEVSQERSAFQK